jgi:type I restriction-modification system DNA methylase subunit/predicted type IV restriction endonuclease
MNIDKDKLKKLSEINIDEIVRKGRDTKVEENVKIILVKPILEYLGYSDKNFDFEHNVKSKRADIAILVDNKPKIIVETKDLDEDLDDHLDQALDYALKKGIWWVLLTNGLEYRLYISFLPNTEEEARLQLKFALKELPEKFEQFYRRIGIEHIIETTNNLEKDPNIRKSREAITAKKMLNDLRESKERLSTAIKSEFDKLYTIDKKFTERIDKWAEEKKIDKEDKEWIDKLCKEGAYTLINRILFLRICEDLRHIPSRLNSVGVYVWDAYLHLPLKDLLIISFNKISERFSKLYESPLFDNVRFQEIKIDDTVLKEILERIKDYNFSGINRDILGPVYEGHISRDERRNLGQYYTPDEVIEYISAEIGMEASDQILDPACGSGGFLLRTYDILKQKMMKEGWAKEAIHKTILSDNLFGIDINPFASQLTIMNLLLKDLDNPTNIINVVEGNSILVSLKSFEKQEKPVQVKNMKEHNLSVYDILGKKYDAVVGNPPYISNKRLTSSEIEHFKNNYLTGGRTNTFALFIQRGIQLLKENGKLGMIVHKNLIKSVSYEGTRKKILDKCKIKKIADLEKGRFEGVTGETIILILEKENNPDKRKQNMIEIISDVENLAERKYKRHKIKQHVFENTPKTIFSIYMDEESRKIIEKIRTKTLELTELIDSFNGINTGDFEKYV